MKKTQLNQKFAQARQSSLGVALVIVLLSVVLLTILILAFFSGAILNRQIAYSSINQVKADMLGRSALSLLLSEIREEIRTGSTPQNGGQSSYPKIYRPSAPLNALPQKEGVSSPDAIAAATLVKVSAANVPLNANTGGRILGSSLSTSATSLNGRYLSAASWFGTLGPRLGSQATLPTWVFLSRDNSIVTTPSYSVAPSAPNFILGRFAYTVYDISGLLNANVAGYPSASATDAAYKSSLADADLTVVPGFAGSTAVDAFVGWRQGSDASAASAYNAYLQNFGLESGFVSTKVGDNAFFSRRDLINFAQKGLNGLTTDGLGYMTHFSYSLNAPSWTPTNSPSVNTASYDYAANSETTTSVNRDMPNVRYSSGGSVTHYNDAGTATTYVVQTGDPLIERRFSLSRIAWLQHKEENPGDATLDVAIQTSFGLQWDSANDHWNYVGPSGSTTQSTIKTLDQVAAETSPREPNFFELLKGGILKGSLGVAVAGGYRSMGERNDGSSGYQSPNYLVDADGDIQILRIGADIIDCAETDNYPTLLDLQITDSSSGSSVDLEVAGVVDLPYIYGVQFNSFFTNQSMGTDASGNRLTKVTNADVIYVPMFFNPHRLSASSVTSGPASIQFDIVSGFVNEAAFIRTDLAFFCDQNFPPIDLSAKPPINITSSQFETFRSSPQPQTQAGASNSVAQLVPYSDASIGNILGYSFYSFENQAAPGTFPVELTSSTTTYQAYQAFLNMYTVNFRLRYQDRNGQMKTYAILGGSEAFLDSTGLGGINIGWDVTAAGGTNFNGASSAVEIDPRTNRIGPGWATGRPTVGPWLPLDPVDDGYLHLPDGIFQSLGFDNLGNNSYLGYWPQGAKSQLLSVAGVPNNPTGQTIVNTLDPDEASNGILRPNDGWLGANANLYTKSTDATHLNGSDESRPVILHRPYRSVAELGYVFRDTQWKTLSFFDETSGDSALLDLFSVADQPAVIASGVNLNTQQTAILTSLLRGAAQNSDGTNPLSAPAQIASAYNAYSFSSGVPTATMPLNAASLANFMSSSGVNASACALDEIKSHREAVARALGNTTQTRTWNLLIDLVAQTGRYPQSAQSTNDFLVEGEKHYWLSVAIDRYTNKIVQEQLEPVNE